MIDFEQKCQCGKAPNLAHHIPKIAILPVQGEGSLLSLRLPVSRGSFFFFASRFEFGKAGKLRDGFLSVFDTS